MQNHQLKNKVTEQELRDFLTTQNYFGRSAKIQRLELVAIQRPGWKQIFEFQVEAKHTAQGWQQLYGVLKDDQRHTTVPEVFLTNNPDDAQSTLRNWSVDHIPLAHNAVNPLQTMALAGAILIAVCALVIAFQLFTTAIS